MAVRNILVFALYFCIANTEYVSRKYCKDADSTKCSIHSVKLDPCPDGPGFCLLRREKHYTLSFDFTPRFDAKNLKMSLLSDDTNNDTFSTVILPPHDPCTADNNHSRCPFEENTRKAFDVDFIYHKKSQGKFPIQLRLWNEDDESQECCFTIKARMLK